MAVTDNCHLYAAVSEDRVNLVAWYIRQQRPSLFKYATGQPQCRAIQVAPRCRIM
jgi:hypothetical protein